MRLSVRAFAIGLSLAGPAIAADVPATSRVEAVTVFPRGAEVTRIAKVRLDPGSHRVIVTDLPAGADRNSIRVEGKATGPLVIGGVDVAVLSVPRADSEQIANERRQIERDIERLRDERSVVEAAIQAAETQKSFIGNLAQLPMHPQPPTGGTISAAPDWAQIFALIGSRMQEAQKVVIGGQVTIREIDRKLEDLERRLAELAPRPDNRTEIRVAANAGAALEAELTVRYMVVQAGWTPQYDARLSTGTRAASPRLTLTRRASISQRSGEAWDNVTLVLSTARPTAGTSAPELRPWTIDFVENVPKPGPVGSVAPAAPMARSARELSSADQMQLESRAKLAEPAVEAVQQTATLEAGSFQATFAIKDRVSVPPTGEAKSVVADEVQLEPALSVRTVPRVDPRAYLYAKVSMPRTAPYLPGQVSLFRDQTFVGAGRLPQLAPGEEHEIGFGADDLVRVRHEAVDEKRSETGLISTSRVDQRTHRLILKSSHERPITYTVLDQLPVSNNQEIRVEYTGRTAPTKVDVEGKRGVVSWTDQLPPETERVIDFGYRVTWPAAKQITPIR